MSVMTKPGPTPPGTPTNGSDAPRAERLAAALRANLRRRRVQKQERERTAEAGEARSEAGGGAETPPEHGSGKES